MKILKNYPFTHIHPPVILIEGFEAYDGNLKDKPGNPHKGIDYVRIVNGKFVSFDVYSAHAGEAFQGLSKSWGKFVSIRKEINKQVRYDTIYAHLKTVNPKIPFFPRKNSKAKKVGLKIKSGTYLGMSGTTGKTNRIIQLHFELHKKINNQRTKIDPYGLNLRFSSGKYPQPGKSLAGLDHYWTNHMPELSNPHP